MTFLAAILAAVWLGGTEGPSAVVDSPNLVGRVVASRFDGTNDYTTVYFTHDMDRAPSAAVCYVAADATNAVYGLWQGGWTNKFDVGGRTYTPDDYVQDGLVAMWDGEWNAGRGVHDASATVWKDLSGNGNDYTLYSGPTWEKNCVYCGGSYGAGGLGAGITMAQSVLTMECVVKADISSASSSCLVAKDSISSGGTTPCLIIKSGSYFEWGYRYDTSSAIANVLISLSSTGEGGWINGDSRVGNASDTWGFNGKLSLMGDARSSNYNTRGRMYNVRLYNRKLTAAEIAKNYSVDYIRFVLGTGADWSDCRVLVTRRPAALRNAEARPDLRFAFGNAETRTPFAVKGLALTVNSNAVEIVDGILTKKGL